MTKVAIVGGGVMGCAAAWALAERGVYETLTAEEQPRTGYNLVAIKRAALATVEQRFAEREQPLVR